MGDFMAPSKGVQELGGGDLSMLNRVALFWKAFKFELGGFYEMVIALLFIFIFAILGTVSFEKGSYIFRSHFSHTFWSCKLVLRVILF